VNSYHYINIILLGVAIIGLILFYRRYKNFISNAVYVIPFIHILVTFLMPLYPEGAFHIGEIRAILIFAFVLIALPSLKRYRITLSIFAFLLYLCTLLIRSSSPVFSLLAIVRLSISMLMLPIAMQYINTFRRLLILNKIYLICGVGIIISFIVEQFTKTGYNPYGIDTVYVAGGGIYITNILVYISLTLYLDNEIRNHFGKKSLFAFKTSFLIATAIITLLIFRRSAVLALITGILIYAIVTRGRYRILTYILIGLSLIVIMPSNVSNKLFQTYVRRGGLTSVLQDEGRHSDIERAIDAFEENSFDHKIFGSELFRGAQFLGTRRTIHNDFANLLVGSGIVGIILYLNIVRCILFYKRKKEPDKSKAKVLSSVRATLFSMVGAWLVFSYTNQLWVIDSYSLSFLYIGSLLGVLVNKDEIFDDEYAKDKTTITVTA